MTPLFSIVIANYNHGHYLAEAIESILHQGFEDYELIVVDAGSTDSSVEVIKKYESNIAWWCSENDDGQSDAFNKGFSHARGRWGCWLNADDIMMPGALRRIARYSANNPQAEWVCGSSVFVDAEKRVLWCSRCVRTWPVLQRKIPSYAVNGPSAFFLIENLKKVGGFDVSLRYTMDTDLWRRFVVAGVRPHYVKEYVWCFRVHEESKTSHKFITGKGSSSFAQEGLNMNLRYGISPFANRLGSILNRVARLISGTYIWSYCDTRHWRGKMLNDVKAS